MDTPTTIVLIIVGSIIGLGIQYWIIRVAVEAALSRYAEELAKVFHKQFTESPAE